jgi:hypothetical protein
MNFLAAPLAPKKHPVLHCGRPAEPHLGVLKAEHTGVPGSQHDFGIAAKDSGRYRVAILLNQPE